MRNLIAAAVEDDKWLEGGNVLITVLVVLAIICCIIWIVRR